MKERSATEGEEEEESSKFRLPNPPLNFRAAWEAMVVAARVACEAEQGEGQGARMFIRMSTFVEEVFLGGFGMPVAVSRVMERVLEGLEVGVLTPPCRPRLMLTLPPLPLLPLSPPCTYAVSAVIPKPPAPSPAFTSSPNPQVTPAPEARE